MSRRTAVAQGIFYLGTGLWPIVHYPSFAKATGDKTDVWLVKTVGGLISAIGAALLVGAAERRVGTALATLGIGAAVALGGADVIYVSQRRIPRVYLLDALAEAGLAAGWFLERR
jgi:hypothetical protein